MDPQDKANPFPQCKTRRRVLIERAVVGAGAPTRKRSWEVIECSRFLVNDEQRRSGLCSSCASGWADAHNYPADEAPPLGCSQGCPWCAVGVGTEPDPAVVAASTWFPWTHFFKMTVELEGIEFDAVLEGLSLVIADAKDMVRIPPIVTTKSARIVTAQSGPS